MSATIGRSTTAKPAPAAQRRVRWQARWPECALAGIVALSAVLYAWRIGDEGWANAYYSVAAKSMSQGLANFLFGAYDPLGTVTVDKPPMALWPQVFSVWVFGFHGWAVLLPQVLEGAAAVFLLHRAVRRWAGENVALLAALVLALTPATVSINRDNNPDTLLVLWCVASAYAVTRAVEPGILDRQATRWLAWSAFFLGCGFLTKMLAGWMPVPAVALAYAAARDTGWGRKIRDLLVAGAVLLVSSAWWVVLTGLWPRPKPYVGGSSDGSALDLVLGYNGFSRIVGLGSGGGPAASQTPELSGGVPSPFGGEPGPARLFNDSVGGQISWLIPWCALVLLVVAVAGAVRLRRREPADRRGRFGWWLWGSWLVILGAVFSSQEGIFHPYYTTQLAPAVAVLAAAGAARLWALYRKRGPFWFLLPAGLAATAVWAWVLVNREPEWHGWVGYAVAALAVPAVSGLLLGRFGARAAQRPALALGLIAALLAPAVWSAAKAGDTGRGLGGGSLPSAGPPGSIFGDLREFAASPEPAPQQGLLDRQGVLYALRTGTMPNGFRLDEADLPGEWRKIADYAHAHANGAPIELAVEGGAVLTGPFLLDTAVKAVALGGYVGLDRTPTVAQLSSWQAQGKLAFVLGLDPKSEQLRSPGSGIAGDEDNISERDNWTRQHCTTVPASAYGGGAKPLPIVSEFGGNRILYRCAR
ncbi:ArnT family glycosyltransferase [Amycolatopsis circi]|uniref:ArnT family glycosyltransferase n=1 Tax=Amycolatopsis circi TaxID=871959 RepID=UPI000E21CB82|nr:glycosyltransferase family 39 protein [Amycolatopsis circi]